ncbi:MAG: bifunctional protein-serine/threonine kinase/phosphatase [Magnetovibrio sp.]|nr:bifunctional protein-serine/threonine kinase/phosphatase [Magnetovibrio sp.]
MANTLSLTIGQFTSAGRKEINEDSYGVQVPEEALLNTKGVAMVIADGMSGSDAGKEASEMCVQNFLIDYYATSETLTVKTAAGQALSALNRWLYGQGQAVYQSHRGMVSTMSTLVLKSATAHIFHVGDSRICRFRDGELQALTKDHRVIVSAEKNFLSRAMGIDLNVDVDYRTVLAQPDDVFIFTTDGVHEYISNSATIDFLKSLKDGDDVAADAIAKSIVDAAYQNGSPDNLTCQIVRLNTLAIEDENDYLDKLQMLPFPPPLSEGMILDGYRVVREIHSSNRSQVYLAIDVDTGNQVALKTPSVNFEDDPTYLQLFIREEWGGKRINSPHVLKVLNHRRKRRFLYSLTEFNEGCTLRQWIDDHPQADIRDVRNIVCQLASGLRAFHRMEMIHQDLKPENILINRDGTVKIIDFGSVKIAGLEEIISPVIDPSRLGTVDYTAPEYLTGQPVSNRCDIYALGVIVYEMLTGKHPYGKGFRSSQHVAKSKYIPAHTVNSDVPDWIDGALAKAVCKDRNRRYEKLSEFVADLKHPNSALRYIKNKPLLEKDPAAFWRGVSMVLGAVIVLLFFR